MLSWIIQITLISIILIFLVHHLINFFKSTLTVPKIKDLVNTPIQKYENIYNIINNNRQNNDNEYNNTNNNIPNNIPNNNDYTLIDLLPKNEESNMKNELKNFLKTQLKDSNTNDIDILAMDSNSNSYSSY
jgi:hypothetical protein